MLERLEQANQIGIYTLVKIWLYHDNNSNI